VEERIVTGVVCVEFLDFLKVLLMDLNIKDKILKFIPEEKLEYCFCGSIKKYEDCCKATDEPYRFSNPKFEKELEKFVKIYQKS
jgi:hypothetical protein